MMAFAATGRGECLGRHAKEINHCKTTKNHSAWPAPSKRKCMVAVAAIAGVPQGYGQAGRFVRADHNAPTDEEGVMHFSGTFVAAHNTKHCPSDPFVGDFGEVEDE